MKTSLALGATETTYTDIGDITIPKGVSRIVGIFAACALETGTATEGAIAVAKLEWTGGPKLDGIPCAVTSCIDVGQIPLVPEYIPVNIPVDFNDKIACYVKTTLDQTGACHGAVFLKLE